MMGGVRQGLEKLPEALAGVVEYAQKVLCGEHGARARAHIAFAMERFATQFNTAKVNLAQVQAQVQEEEKKVRRLPPQSCLRDAMMALADSMIAAVCRMLQDKAGKAVGQKRTRADVGQSCADEGEVDEGAEEEEEEECERYEEEDRVHVALERSEVARGYRAYEYAARLSFKSATILLDIPTRADSYRRCRSGPPLSPSHAMILAVPRVAMSAQSATSRG